MKEEHSRHTNYNQHLDNLDFGAHFIAAHVGPRSSRPWDSVFGICGRFPSRNSHGYGQEPVNEPL
jgi:hypothetical protein